MFQIVIRNTTTLGMVALAVVFYNIYPHNTFNNHIVVALVCWVIAFGPIAWIRDYFYDAVDETNWNSLRWVFWTVSLAVVLFGLGNLLYGCAFV